jgi:CubicO group peptidase (beta-lactamase class C family)
LEGLIDFGGDVKKTLITLACVLGAVATAVGNRLPAADDVDGKVDALVQDELHRQRIPGAAVGVYRDGKLTKAQGYGLANVEWDAAVTPDTIFQSGSVGKQFTAAAVMMLVEEGKVGLDDPITKYFPDAPDTWNDIKVHNLLSHTSGLGEYETGARTKPGGPFYMRLDYSEDELYKRITEMPMDFKPGEDWSYRNTNYVLLGILIHKVTGKFYGDFLQERIFRPLGMSRTRIISEEDIIPRRSSGYRLVKGELKNQEWVSPSLNSTADGALYFTVEDLQKWDAALYTERLLKKASLDRMWTVEKLNNGKQNKANYGFAWEINSVNGHRVIEHGGAWQGFTTYIARYVDDRLTVVALTNLDSGHSNPKKITSGVAAIYNPALKAAEEKPIEDKEPQVSQRVRELLGEIADGKAKPDEFTAEAQKRLFPDEMQELGPALKEFGELKRLELMERTEEGERRNYRYRAQFPNLTLMISVGLTKENKIARLNFSEE